MWYWYWYSSITNSSSMTTSTTERALGVGLEDGPAGLQFTYMDVCMLSLSESLFPH